MPASAPEHLIPSGTQDGWHRSRFSRRGREGQAYRQQAVVTHRWQGISYSHPILVVLVVLVVFIILVVRI